MKKSIPTACPHLGLRNEQASRYLEPSDAHRCYSPLDPGDVDLEYQQAVCFSDSYAQCKRFQAVLENQALIPVAAIRVPEPTAIAVRPQTLPMWRDPNTALARVAGSRRLEIFLWIMAAVLGLVAIYAALPLLTGLAQPLLATPTQVAGFVLKPTKTPTPGPTLTVTATPTELATPSVEPIPTAVPLLIPQPPPDGLVFNLLADPAGTGWVADGEALPHWGERYLLAGTVDDKAYASVLKFNLPNLPADSKILFAALELTGRDGSQLGKTGQWQLELIDPGSNPDWFTQVESDIKQIPSMGFIGKPLSVSDLAERNVNRFEFDGERRALIESQLAKGQLNFILRATGIEGNSLFNWDSGTGGAGQLDAPTLYLVAVPGSYFVVTNTPVPTNVLTAAAQAFRSTASAKKIGTPTPLPVGVVTATGQAAPIFVPPPPTAGNASTRVADSVFATAVAITTGTYTPTPPNVIIAYPTATPAIIRMDQVIPGSTPTPRGANVDYFATPIPRSLVNKILVLSDRLGQNYTGLPIVMDENGVVNEILSSPAYYDAAAARESFAPDRKRRAIVARDSDDVLQIWILDLASNAQTRVTTGRRGISYDPVWSPDGRSIAYVSTQTGITEIYIYDLETKTSRQLTITSGPDFYNQRPSWSPDSQKIVFKSNRDDVARFQIYRINADGSNLTNLSANQYSEFDPIWVKP